MILPLTDVARLKQRQRIKRRTPKSTENAQLICSTVSTNFVKDDIASNSLDFLFAVSHFGNNVTQPLNDDDEEETEDYDFLDEPSTSSTSISDIALRSNKRPCWSAERAKVVFVPGGHSRFCQTCADRCFAYDNMKCACAVCRARTDFVMHIFN